MAGAEKAREEVKSTNIGWQEWTVIGEGVAQIGCLTLVIILAALGLGLWLDNILGTRPWFTLGLILVSIPVSLAALVRAALNTAQKVQPPEPEKEATNEDSL